MEGKIPWNKGNRTYLRCAYCDKEFEKKHYIARFCSQVCSGKVTGFKKNVPTWNKGLKGSQVPWNKGLKGYNAGEKSPNWKGGNPKCLDCGKQLSKGANKYCKRRAHVGDRNKWWKGGITPVHKAIRNSFEYEDWRKAIFERDLYTCQHCGEIGGRLNADHIKPFSLFPELRLDLSNGQTLCEICHRIKTMNDFKNYNFYPKNGQLKLW